MDFLEKRYKKNDDIVFRKIADEFLLVPIRNNIRNFESIFTLNDVGTRVWELIDGSRAVSAIRDCIVDEFEVSPETVTNDLQEFLQSLEETGSILTT